MKAIKRLEIVASEAAKLRKLLDLRIKIARERLNGTR